MARGWVLIGFYLLKMANRLMTKDKPDLALVLEHYGASVPVRYGYASMKCVLHDDTHNSATVNLDKQKYYCFVCDFAGDVYDVVKNKEGIGKFDDAVARAEAITNGNRASISQGTQPRDSLLPTRARDSKRSRRYIPPRYS